MKKVKIMLFLLLITSYSTLLGQDNTIEDIQQIIQKLEQGESVEAMVINLGDITFDTGATNLKPLAKTYLNEVATLMKSATNIKLNIKGYCDNIGSPETNRKLSLERAVSVQNYLVSQGVGAERLSARGYGSTNFIASNDTEEGRAKNRRTELEIIREESVEQIQDVIILVTGERIGCTVMTYDKNTVSYKQFSNDNIIEIEAKLVRQVLFASGRTVNYVIESKKPTPQPDEPEPKKRDPISVNIKIFKESESFHQGNFVFGFGMGFKNNVAVEKSINQTQVPPALFFFEIPLKYNIGVGLAAEAFRWQPDSDSTTTFGYYTLSPKVAYHFNLGEKIDFYAGGSINTRLAMVNSSIDANLNTSNFKIDVGTFVGLRYYLNKNIGLFLERGSDGVACNKGGIVFKFGNTNTNQENIEP